MWGGARSMPCTTLSHFLSYPGLTRVPGTWPSGLQIQADNDKSLIWKHMHTPSPFITGWLSEIRRGGTVLDLASGRGRHTRVCLEHGLNVTAVDIETKRLEDLEGAEGLSVIAADLENQPWPLSGATFDAVIVTNYLWRPLFQNIRNAVAQGGLLLYETFGVGNERYGKPSNPNFLLEDGELREAFNDGFEILEYRHALEPHPVPAVRQRLAARKLSVAHSKKG